MSRAPQTISQPPKRQWDDNGHLIGGIDYPIVNGWKFRAEPISIAERYTQLIDPNGSALMDGFIMEPDVAAASMRPVEASPLPGDDDWQWLIGKEFYLGTVEDVCNHSATVTRGDDTFRIRISELLEEETKHSGRHREQATHPLREALQEVYQLAKVDTKAFGAGRHVIFIDDANEIRRIISKALAAHPTKAESLEVPEVIGYAIARLEDDEPDQALNALKVARGDYVKDHYPDDNSRMAVQQLRDAVNRMAAPIDYADALLRYIEQLERRALAAHRATKETV